MVFIRYFSPRQQKNKSFHLYRQFFALITAFKMHRITRQTWFEERGTQKKKEKKNLRYRGRETLRDVTSPRVRAYFSNALYIFYRILCYSQWALLLFYFITFSSPFLFFAFFQPITFRVGNESCILFKPRKERGGISFKKRKKEKKREEKLLKVKERKQ